MRSSEQVESFCREMSHHLKRTNVECRIYIPRGSDEATYELWAASWLVQHGDLTVLGKIPLCEAFRVLGQGRSKGQVQVQSTASLDEVLEKYADLDAADELRKAFTRASELSGQVSSVVAKIKATVRLGGLRRRTLIHLDTDSSINTDEPAQGALPAAQQDLKDDVDPGVPTVPTSAFYKVFEQNEVLMRALTREKLFTGTLSAGGGSCQVTLRSLAVLGASKLHSIPIGNRLTTVQVDKRRSSGDRLFGTEFPETARLAWQFLTSENREVWNEQRMGEWADLIKCCLKEHQVVSGQRGLFLGITAVYYAAKDAGVDCQLIRRDEFVTAVADRIDQAMAMSQGVGGADPRLLANLVLVKTLVEHVLHRTATIVCKREWLGRDGSEFVATWTFGLFLKQLGQTEASPRFLRDHRALRRKLMRSKSAFPS